MSLEDMTELQTELQRLRAALAEKDRAPPKTYREVVQPPTQTRQKRQLTAKSDVSVDLEDPELMEEQAALWHAAKGKGKVGQSLDKRGPSPSPSSESMPSLLTDSSGSKSETGSDSCGSKRDPESEPSNMARDFVPKGKGHTARLRRKRNLNKLAWQVADHLPCKFSEWRKGPEKWLELVEAACLEVELPPSFIMGKLSKAIGFDSMKMADWLSDRTPKGGRVKAFWSEYWQAFINFFPGLLANVTRDIWIALSQEKCGSYHKYLEQFQQQAEEL